MISGLISGISNMVSSLYSSIYSALSGLVSSAKSALGIGSPSKVFAEEVGQWIPEGIAEGIEGSISGVDALLQDALSGVIEDRTLDEGTSAGEITIKGRFLSAFNTADGEVTFETISYETVGTYYYLAYQVEGTDDEIQYDDMSCEIVVTVTAEDDESLLATIVYPADSEFGDDANISYDTTVYEISVTVSADGSGDLAAEISEVPTFTNETATVYVSTETTANSSTSADAATTLQRTDDETQLGLFVGILIASISGALLIVIKKWKQG